MYTYIVSICKYQLIRPTPRLVFARVKRNVVPLPEPSDSTRIRPLCNSTIRRTSARPMPSPSELVLFNLTGKNAVESLQVCGKIVRVRHLRPCHAGKFVPLAQVGGARVSGFLLFFHAARPGRYSGASSARSRLVLARVKRDARFYGKGPWPFPSSARRWAKVLGRMDDAVPAFGFGSIQCGVRGGNQGLDRTLARSLRHSDADRY